MSKQNLSAAQREAIWLAHGQKCAYTGKLLEASNFHIDHIIPESLTKDPAVLKEKITELNLPTDFNIHGYENLLPCCPRANYQKSNLILPYLYYYLDIAAGKKERVEANLERIEKRNNSGKGFILLQQHIERGDIDRDKAEEIFQQYSERPEAIFELIESMPFANSSEVKSIAKADIESLWDLPICLKNFNIDGLTFKNKEGKQTIIRTCRDYQSASEKGYFALNNFFYKASVSFIQQCGLLNLLQSAKTPEQSFISVPKVGVVDLELLPLSLFPWIGDEDIRIVELPPNKTYQDKVKDREFIVKSVSQNSLRIEGDGMGQRLTEVLRADLNGDGIEDILLFEYCYATGGTLGYGGNRILTRKSSEGKFEIVE